VTSWSGVGLLGLAVAVGLAHGCAARTSSAVAAADVRTRRVERSTNTETAERRDPAIAAALERLKTEESVSSHLAVAEAYRRAGIADKAVGHVDSALLLDRRSAAAYDTRARLWRDAGLLAMALPDAYRAERYAPKSAEVQNTLGTILQGLGQRDAAAERYRRAVVLDGRAAYALSNLCAIDLERGEPARAAASCQSALAIDPALDVAHRNLERAEAALARAKESR
jgi:tetratricopeptide (TPR) repeat protein